MKTIIFSLSLILLLTETGLSQNNSVQNVHPKNVPPATGQLLKDSEIGLSVNIPEGWIAQDQGDFVILGHNTIPGMILLIPHSLSTVEELREDARIGLVDTGINLPLDGEVEDFNSNGVMAYFRGTIEGNAARGYGISLLSVNGGGGSIIAITGTPLFTDEHPRLVHSIANSLKVEKIDVSAKQKEWDDYLRNKKLIYFDSYSSNTPGGGGYNTKKSISLCPEGSFTDSQSSVTSLGDIGGYAGGQGNGSGTWEVKSYPGSDYLILKYYDGSIAEYKLEYTDRKLYLNGSRYHRADASMGAEYAPACY